MDADQIIEHTLALLVEEGTLYQEQIAWLEAIIEAGRKATGDEA